MSIQTVTNSNDLAYKYDWFQKTFPPIVQKIFDDFFAQDFTFTLLGVCKNVNTLSNGEAYFVTKVKIDNQHDVFFRLSENTIELLLNKVLGRSNRAFDLNKLTELETKIITTFNDCLYRTVTKLLKPPPPTLNRTNFDVVYLVFVVTDNDAGRSGRFVLTLPDVLIDAVALEEKSDYPIEHFVDSEITVALEVGKTVFSLHDLKNLEVDDMVVFEDSNLNSLKMSFLDYNTDIRLKPNLALVVPIDNDGGSDVSEEKNINIWDSIEVEMVGHFDSVNITLGELKKIQAGMVVDLTSIYKNRVTLTVEDKPIASGELVIINDKYGVKVTEVHAPKAKPEVYANDEASQDVAENGEYAEDEEEIIEDGAESGQAEGGDEEEFDYSDFDLEEDI